MTSDNPGRLARAVAFDLDGLMINSEELYRESGSRMLLRRGHRPDETVFRAMMGRPNRDALQVMADAYGLVDSLAELEAETDREMRELMEARLAPLPGLLSLLDWLDARRVPAAVTTSATRSYVDYVLESIQVQDRFQFTLTADDVIRGKPDPEIYQRAAERFGIEPCRLVVLEDSVNGCRASLAAGARTIAVPSHYSGSIDLPVDLIADGLGDPRICRLITALE